MSRQGFLDRAISNEFLPNPRRNSRCSGYPHWAMDGIPESPPNHTGGSYRQGHVLFLFQKRKSDLGRFGKKPRPQNAEQGGRYFHRRLIAKDLSVHIQQLLIFSRVGYIFFLHCFRIQTRNGKVLVLAPKRIPNRCFQSVFPHRVSFYGIRRSQCVHST